ncbi:MAG: type IV pilus secretin PilQ [Smithellaceae bacterium]|nr:type IV pilus secretin PilQ [Smithellaceae bacterium]
MEDIALTLSANHIKIDKIMMCFLMLIFFVGCSGDLQSTKKDPFFEKWDTMADNSQGHSPEAKPKKIDLMISPSKKAQTAATMEETSQKLPTKPINLTMRQADLKAVLRAMARSVNCNLLVKNDLKGDVSVDFRSVPWDQAFTGLLKTHGLSYVWEGKIIRVMTIEDIEQELKQKVQLRDIQWVEPLMNPVVVKIDYADSEKLAKTLQDFLTKDKDGKTRGSVTRDEHSNSLVISANSQDLARMIPIIEKIDKPTPQILIKANIVETSKNVARDLGILWGGKYNTGDATATGGSSAPVGLGGSGLGMNFPAALGGATTPLGSLALLFGTVGGNLLEVQLQALQSDSKLNILSSPSITTLDNQKAFTENGAKVPYATLDTSVTPPTRVIKFEDVVLRLEITPHVIDGKNLKMTILVKKDEVDPVNKLTDGTPFIIKKQTQTVLIVKDGETIVISGLTKNTNSFGDKGLPLFKDVPVLGYLFKADSKSDAMEEVLIFITPTILQTASVEK